MAKLTKAQRHDLEGIENDLCRAVGYLQADRTFLGSFITPGGGSTLAYIRAKDGNTVEAVNKEYGSQITGLYDALRRVRAMLG
jgi:hypothetical protein